MNRFVQKTNSKAGRNVTPQQRYSEFKAWTHLSGGKLFCTPCNIVVNHERKSVLEQHALSKKHKKRLAKLQEGAAPKRQKTVTVCGVSSTPSTISAEERNDICKAWVAMCAEANIPLSKSDHPAVRKFLSEKVTNGGAIPGAPQLRRQYLEKEVDDKRQLLKSLLKEKPVSISCDETTDDMGRYVLNVLASPLVPDVEGDLPSYLLDTLFLERTNHATVAQAVVKVVVENGIAFQDVLIFNSDNAAYMKKAFTDVLKGIFPCAVHVTCLAHIMNLLGESFRKPFSTVDKFVKAFNALFWNSPARKGRYLRYLTSAMGEEEPKMVPNPIATRWNCWYDCVQYHRDRLCVYKKFVEEEALHCKGQMRDSLSTLLELLERDTVKSLQADMRFIVEKSGLFIQLTDIFQSHKPLAIKVWDSLEELEFMYPEAGFSKAEALEFFPPDMSDAAKEQCQERFSEAFMAVHDKVKKYMTDNGQPGIHFLNQMRIFHPKNLTCLPQSPSHYDSIPALFGVPAHEFSRYFGSLGPQAVKQSVGEMDLHLFWKSFSDQLPALSKVALRYAFASCSSADAERSFSLFNLLFSSRRQRFSEDSIRHYLFLYYNKFCSSAFFD